MIFDLDKVGTIVAIDPGKSSGAIAIMDLNDLSNVRTHRMMSSMELGSILKNLNRNQRLLVVLERVGMFPSDDKGKQFRTESLVRNSAEIKTICQLFDIPLLEVSPTTWQHGLKLVSKEDQTKTDRKNRYKKFAGLTFPQIKVDLKNSDALCLLEYTRRLFDTDKKRIEELYKITHTKKTRKKRKKNEIKTASKETKKDLFSGDN